MTDERLQEIASILALQRRRHPVPSALEAGCAELLAELAATHSALDAAGIPRETAAGPWPLERRVRMLAAWQQESQRVAELNPELVMERERLRSTIDALVSGLESPAVVAVRILARLAGEPGCVIPGEERLVGVVCAAMEREGAGG